MSASVSAVIPKPLRAAPRAAHASGLRSAPRESQPSVWMLKRLNNTAAPCYPARHVVCCSSSGASGSTGPRPFYFDPTAYRKVRLDLVKADGREGHLVLVDHSASGQWQDGKLQGLVLCVGGDTLDCIVRRIRKKVHVRPTSLDILWGVLERAQSMHNAEWEVVRVAVVAMTNDTFIGRAFFGDRLTGKVYWDCDIRPSDAVWLSQRCGCPIYVENSVWLQNITTYAGLQEIMGHKPIPHEKPSPKPSPSPDVAELVGSRKAGVLDDDPERVKMLKRMLAMAIKEENYHQAALLRDHPTMAKYNTMRLLKQAGRVFEAQVLADELNRDPVEPIVHLEEPSGTSLPDDTRQEYNQP